RIGYLGMLSRWVDSGLLLQLVVRNPEWKFIIAGPQYNTVAFSRLEPCSNVELRGEVSAKEVPTLLATFDIGLALYRREPWLDGDSMKIFEYLAAGIPVV